MKTALRKVVIPPLRSYFRHTKTQFAKRFLWTYLLAHLWWLEGPVEAETFFGSTLSVDARDSCGRYIYYFGIWEPNLTTFIQERLRDGDVFIDVGANVGYYSFLAASILRNSGSVVSLEAMPSTFAMFRHGIMRSHVDNIRALNVAAWDEVTELPMLSGSKDIGTSTLIPEWAERWGNSTKTMVRAAPLSNLLTQQEMEAARLIKIDTEGAEWQVIAGMTPLLKHSRRDLEIVVELTDEILARQGHSVEEVFDIFGAYGFRPFLLRNDYSPAVYYRRDPVDRPVAIEHLPGDTEQSDVIFSRILT